MKITKRQLKRIIREECCKLAETSAIPGQAGIDDYLEIFDLMNDPYDEQEMIANVFEISNSTVYDAMTPRTEISAIE